MGGLYLKQNNITLAKKSLKESISINDRPGFERGDAQTAKLKLAKAYLTEHNSEETLRLIKEVEDYLIINKVNSYSNQSLRIKLLDLTADYYLAQNDFKSAFENQKRYRQLNDSILQINNQTGVNNMENAFKMTEQSYELALLNKENTYKDHLLILGIVFSSIIIILLLIVYKNLKKSRKNVQILKLLNEKINHQNKNMRKALDALEQSQDDNTKMLKVIAHDLRNPISAISMLVAYMKREKSYNTAELEILDMISKSANSALDLANDLLNIQSKATELKIEEEDILTTLTYCIDQLKLKANAKNQQLLLEAYPLIIAIDSGKIWRVLSNLITNAIKFSPIGAPINIKMKSTTSHVTIAVEDFGIGIPEEYHDKIFEMFSEAKRKGTEGEVSSGLGLSISKQIVEAHGGRIWFETVLNKGTTFYVEIPRV
ncbi:MAG: HAMP domain-containing histidine kinase [Pedobacter sp.]|nr:MAG: HAMP domain-containing histidine kinase [Pedobacter sp.]